MTPTAIARTATLLAAVAAVGLVGCVTGPSATPGDRGEGATIPTDPVLPPLTGDGTRPREVAYRVRTLDCAGMRVGSAFPVEPDLVVTNAHVVSGDVRKVEVSSWDGVVHTVDVVGVATVSDLAILRLTVPLPGPVVVLGKDPEPGDPVVAVGYPAGGRRTESPGTVVDYVDTSASPGGLSHPVIRFRADIATGSSGGPLLAADGSVAGVVYAIEDGTEDAATNGLAVPVSVLAGLDRSADFTEVPDGC